MAKTVCSRLGKFRSFFSWSLSMRFSPPPITATACPAKMETSNGICDNGRVMSLTPDNLESSARLGATMISTGGLIATPTDTVYGIASDAQNDEAISKIYEIKGRIASKPIAICVSKIDQVYKWGKVVVDRTLLEDLLPGPVTLVFERQSVLNPNLNPNTNLIGIRIPGHRFIMNLVEYHGGPVALTSANFSNDPSTLEVEEFKDMWPRLQGIFDGGRLSSCEKSEAAARAGSTVIDLSNQGYFRIIRNGTAYDQCVNLLRNKYKLIEISK